MPDREVPYTEKGGSFQQKHRNTRADYHQAQADYIEFESLPYLIDPLIRGYQKRAIAKHRDEVIKLRER